MRPIGKNRAEMSPAKKCANALLAELPFLVDSFQAYIAEGQEMQGWSRQPEGTRVSHHSRHAIEERSPLSVTKRPTHPVNESALVIPAEPTPAGSARIKGRAENRRTVRSEYRKRARDAAQGPGGLRCPVACPTAKSRLTSKHHSQAVLNPTEKHGAPGHPICE
jgi:hypothetical protein